MLTDEQINYFQTFGFVVLHDYLTSQEVEKLESEFEVGLDSAYSHEKFDGTQRQWTALMGPNTPFFAQLPEDIRFCEVAEQLYGDDCFLAICDGNRYVGNSGWHPDHDVDSTKDCWGIKLAIYLEPVRGDSGALRVIPGSHRNPFHTDVQSLLKGDQLAIADVPSFVCESNPGDVVAFDMRCWHASCGGTEGRRMSTVVFYNHPQSAVEADAMRRRAEGNNVSLVQFRRPNDPMYDPYWLSNPNGSARRSRWINRLKEFGFVES